MVRAIVLINAEPARVADLAQRLADHDSIREVYSVAGDEDLVAIINAKHHEDLADVVTNVIAKEPGVTRTRTLVAFRAWGQSALSSEWGVNVD
jgi:DNA-binding Lrp family transcriptional regulator